MIFKVYNQSPAPHWKVLDLVFNNYLDQHNSLQQRQTNQNLSSTQIMIVWLSVVLSSNSPSQDYTHPDDHILNTQCT